MVANPQKTVNKKLKNTPKTCRIKLQEKGILRASETSSKRTYTSTLNSCCNCSKICVLEAFPATKKINKKTTGKGDIQNGYFSHELQKH